MDYNNYNQNNQNENEQNQDSQNQNYQNGWSDPNLMNDQPVNNQQSNDQPENNYQGSGQQENGRQDNGIFGNESQFSRYRDAYAPKNDGNYGNYGNYYYGGMPSGGQEPQKPKKKHKAAKMIAAVMAGVLLVGAAAGGGIYVGSQLAENSRVENRQDAPERVEIGSNKDSQIGSTETGKGIETTASTSDVSAIVENTMPAIVAINCTSEYNVSDFWGQQFTQEAKGSGSGIIIGQNSEEVLIATNNHVVATKANAKNEKIEVVFGNEASAEATIKGTEEGSDLAVVSVKLSELDDDTLNYIKIATLGDSNSLKVGEMAIAIGNALGYGQSTTVGWVSALNREVATEDYTMSLIQTDAAINPGNSGGALLNIRGEVIGINSAKYSDESVEGMGFAIPISDAIPIINDLMNREEIPEREQAFLGIVGQDVTAAYNERYGMPIGVYVYQVSEKSPAEQAGLRMGDIITEFNGRTVKAMSDLQSILATYRAGEEVTLTVQVFENGAYTETTLHAVLGYKNR